MRGGALVGAFDHRDTDREPPLDARRTEMTDDRSRMVARPRQHERRRIGGRLRFDHWDTDREPRCSTLEPRGVDLDVFMMYS